MGHSRTSLGDGEDVRIWVIRIPTTPSISIHVLAGAEGAQDHERDCVLALAPSKQCWILGRAKKRNRVDARSNRGQK
jgi:hypothetical protein